MARQLTFSEEERARLVTACRALSTTFEELVHWATLHALDELEGLAQDYDAIKAFYAKENE
jgi:hypothetical protein